MKKWVLFFIFLFFVNLINANSVVSDTYKVDAINVGILGEESENDIYDSRSTLAYQQSGESNTISSDYELIVGGYLENSSKESFSGSSVSPNGGGGGSSGGGGIILECQVDSDCKDEKVCWKGTCVKLFDVKILNFQSPVRLGDYFEFTYYAKGMADIENDVLIDFWIEKDGKKIASGRDTIYFGTYDEKTETSKLFLPKDVETGDYNFVVQVDYEGYKAKSYRNIWIEVGENGMANIDIVAESNYYYFLIAIVLLSLIVFVLILITKRLKNKRILQNKRERVLSHLKEHSNKI